MTDSENLQQQTEVIATPPITLSDSFAAEPASQPQTQWANQEQNSSAIDNQSATVDKQETVETKQEGFQARNFRELKAAAERERKEKEQLAKRVAEMERLLQNQQQKQADEPDEDIGIDDNDLLEGRHVKPLAKEVRQAKREAQKLRAEVEGMKLEREILSELPDFYSVVTKEAVEAYALMDPVSAKMIASHPDIKMQSVAIYGAIKKSDIHNMHKYDTQKELVKQNLGKPKPVPEVAQHGGTSALARGLENYSGDLTDEMKRMYYQEMKRAQKGR